MTPEQVYREAAEVCYLATQMARRAGDWTLVHYAEDLVWHLTERLKSVRERDGKADGGGE